MNLGADHYINKIGNPETVYGELAYGIHHAVESKRADEALRFSDAAFKSIQEGVVASDLGYTITHWNEASERIFGIKASEAIGKKLFDVVEIVENYPSQNKERFKTLETQGYYQEEQFQRTKNKEAWVRVSIQEIREEGRRCGWVALHTDITERKKAEERFETYLDLARVMMIAIDTKGIVTYVNKKCCEALKCKEEEIVGKDWFSNFLPERLKKETKAYSKKLLAGQIEPVEYYENPVSTKDGEERLIAWHNILLRDEKGKIIGHLSSGEDVTDRKKAERMIRESQEKFEGLFMGNPEAFIRVDSSFRILDVNPRFEELFGYSLDEIRGKHIDNVTVPKDMMKEAETLNQKAKKGYVYRDTVRKRKDGSLVHVSISAAPVIVEGKRLEYVAVYKDISQLKNTEKALKESEEKYREIFEVAPDGMITIDLKGVVTSVNPTFLKLTGYSKKEIVGKHFTKLGTILARDIPRYLKLMSSALRGKLPSKFEYSYVRKNGTIGWAEGHFGILRKDGKITGFQGILREVTEHKKIQTALGESEKRYQTLMEGTPVGILNMNIKGKITYINKKFEEIIGYPREEIIGKTWLNLARKQGIISDETLKTIAKKIKARLMGRSSSPLRVRLTRKDGGKIWVEGESKAIKRFRVPVGLQASFRDITELVEKDESLKRSLEKSETLNEKLNVVGKLTRHDVRNKLSAVANNVYLAKQRLSSDSEALKYLGDVESAVRQTGRIFDFARTYEKLGMEELAYTDVEKTLKEATILFSNLHSAKIVNDCHGLTVLADSLLRQLFYNLIDNSLKHGEKVSRIRAYYEEAGKDKMKLVYEDDGVGIPKAEKEKIFREGYGKDSGYGLYLIRKMCEVYGWNIRETGKHGKGVQFTITIPKMNKSGKMTYQLH